MEYVAFDHEKEFSAGLADFNRRLAKANCAPVKASQPAVILAQAIYIPIAQKAVAKRGAAWTLKEARKAACYTIAQVFAQSGAKGE